ncbi:MAG: MFS transporter [Candidatus Heimdallarchaeota archaeon]|nr:MAG: MFS transporter [Candidatus Heimdallarchaeota archaeon]
MEESSHGQFYDNKLQKWSFGLGSFAQWFINSAFNTWVLTFYFAAVRLPIQYIMTAFILWTVWNAINDPLIGYLSDRTHTRLGRRKPYIMIGLIPIAIIEIILWIPPVPLGDDYFITFLYLLIILFCYDTFYTMVALPYDSLFPELYTSVEERADVNSIRQVLSTVGLISAFLIPGIFIGDQDVMDGYLINGIVTTLIILVTLLISLKWGVVERPEFTQDHHQEFNFFQGLKHTFRLRSFVLYTIMFFLYEYTLLVLSSTVPLYAEWVLGIQDTFLTSILLGTMFIVGIVTVLFWRKLDVKYGSRKVYAVSIVLYIITSIPLLVINSFETAIIIVVFMGIGFGGMLYFIYLIIADVIDDDELRTGLRREGTFFGITNFFMRLSMIFSIITVSLVFSTTGWETYEPNPGIDVIQGLRLLVFLFPALALGITLICLYFYPYSRDYIIDMKSRITELHRKKLDQIIT